MSVTIIIDGSIKCNRKFDFEIQSSRVIETRYNSFGAQVHFTKTVNCTTYDVTLIDNYPRR